MGGWSTGWLVDALKWAGQGLLGAPASFESDLNLLKKFMRTSCLTAACRCTRGTAAALLVLQQAGLGVLIFMEARSIVMKRCLFRVYRTGMHKQKRLYG